MSYRDQIEVIDLLGLAPLVRIRTPATDSLYHAICQATFRIYAETPMLYATSKTKTPMEARQNIVTIFKRATLRWLNTPAYNPNTGRNYTVTEALHQINNQPSQILQVVKARVRNPLVVQWLPFDRKESKGDRKESKGDRKESIPGEPKPSWAYNTFEQLVSSETYTLIVKVLTEETVSDSPAVTAAIQAVLQKQSPEVKHSPAGIQATFLAANIAAAPSQLETKLQDQGLTPELYLADRIELRSQMASVVEASQIENYAGYYEQTIREVLATTTDFEDGLKLLNLILARLSIPESLVSWGSYVTGYVTKRINQLFWLHYNLLDPKTIRHANYDPAYEARISADFKTVAPILLKSIDAVTEQYWTPEDIQNLPNIDPRPGSLETELPINLNYFIVTNGSSTGSLGNSTLQLLSPTTSGSNDYEMINLIAAILNLGIIVIQLSLSPFQVQVIMTTTLNPAQPVILLSVESGRYQTCTTLDSQGYIQSIFEFQHPLIRAALGA